MSAPIITENAAELLTQLEVEAEPRRRAILTDLLVAEENRIAQARGRRELVSLLVARGRERVRRQGEFVAALALDHPQRAIAELILENMTRLQNLFEAHRRLFGDDEPRVPWR